MHFVHLKYELTCPETRTHLERNIIADDSDNNRIGLNEGWSSTAVGTAFFYVR